VANVPEGKVSVTPNVTAFFHEGTYTITYVVNEQEGDHCAIIDSVLDYDLKSGRTSTPSFRPVRRAWRAGGRGLRQRPSMPQPGKNRRRIDIDQRGQRRARLV